MEKQILKGIQEIGSINVANKLVANNGHDAILAAESESSEEKKG